MLKRILYISLLLSAFACKKPIEYPAEPVIRFQSISVEKATDGYDDKVYVTISFTDGDGDIGYYPRESGRNEWIFDDPASPYYNNYIVKTSILRSGTWVVDTTNVSARLPYMTPDGSIKALKGEIQRELTLPPALSNDTLQYEIFIWDRALHKSNTVTTPAIVINTR
ncbi:MAG: hypothetical protein ACKO1U_01795 [Bacteroidota bacterium]